MKTACALLVIIAVSGTCLAQLPCQPTDDELADLRAQLAAEQARSELLQQQVAALKKVTIVQAGKIAALQESQAELAGMLARAQRVVDNREPMDEENLAPLPPMLNGLILDKRKNFVEISLGSDDGLRSGHTLDVIREGVRGRIIVRRTDPDRAIGEIIPEFQKLPIGKGDRVTPHRDSQRVQE